MIFKVKNQVLVKYIFIFSVHILSAHTYCWTVSKKLCELLCCVRGFRYSLNAKIQNQVTGQIGQDSWVVVISKTGHTKKWENKTASIVLSQDKCKIKQPLRSPARNLVFFMRWTSTPRKRVNSKSRCLILTLWAADLSPAGHGPDTCQNASQFNQGCFLVPPSPCIKSFFIPWAFYLMKLCSWCLHVFKIQTTAWLQSAFVYFFLYMFKHHNKMHVPETKQGRSAGNICVQRN